MRRRAQPANASVLALTAVVLTGPVCAQTALPDITIGQKKPPVVHPAPQPTAKPVQPRVAAQPAPAPPRPARTPAPTRAAAPTHAPAPARPSVTARAPTQEPSRAPTQEPSPSAPTQQPQSQVEQAQEHFNATQSASSEQFTTGKEINSVPFSRPGAALETAVPGLVVTQHSGEGKANQYQLRGFQLDHGTDFEITLDGMPLNMPTHGHGQGYADANFMIPELLSYVIARKGPYYADEGDFSAAGAAHMQYKDDVPDGLFSTTVGSFDYGRQLAINASKANGGTLLQAAEFGIYNGPWTAPDEMHKINGVLRWSQGSPENGLAIDAMAYANRWHSTNQIPERAVTEGFIPLWGNINPTDRGDTTRFSLSGQWNQSDASSHSKVEAFAIHSTLDLYNDFDYYLSQPLLGDQFRQFDRRTILGLKAEHGWKYELNGLPVETRIGVQSRYDDIRNGIQDTYNKMAFQTVGNYGVDEGNVGLWTDTTVKWTSWLRTTAGVRYDYFAASVGDYQNPLHAVWLTAAGVPIGIPSFLYDPRTLAPYMGPPTWVWTGPWNSGSKSAALGSPKANVVFGPWEKTEFFLNFGEGFHSTDARGTVANLSPIDGTESAKTAFLVKARGAEIGARSKFFDGLDTTLTFWWLNFDSESQFDGDTGTTLFGRPSRRYGIELTNRYTFSDWARIDADLSLSHARSRGWDVGQTVTYAGLLDPSAIGYFTYLGNAPGNYIPEAPPVVASINVDLGKKTGWFGGSKYIFKGAYPLTEDGYFKAPATGWLDLRVGYRWENGLKLQLDVFNALNSRSDAITYAYGSLLPNDPLFAPCVSGAAPATVCAIGQMDRHFHPMEPTAARVSLSGPLTATVFGPILAPKPGAPTPVGDFLALADSLVAPPPETETGSGLPSKKAPPLVEPPPRWTGFYLGATTGTAFRGDSNIYYETNPAGPGFDPGLAYLGNIFLGGGNFGSNNVAFIGGGEAGYNYQFNPRLLLGVETDFQGRAGGAGATNNAGARPSYTIPGNLLLGYYAGSQTFDYLGTARVRLGYVFRPTLLLYTTGGLAYGKTNLVANAQVTNVDPGGNIVTLGGGAASSSQTRAGFSVGGGFEWMFSPGWSAKAEYLYYDLGNFTVGMPQYTTALATGTSFVNTATTLRAHADGQLVRAGLNYHFDWAAPAPLVANIEASVRSKRFRKSAYSRPKPLRAFWERASGAAASVLGVRKLPALLRALVRRAVDLAALVALGTVLRRADEAHAHLVALFRLLDLRHCVVGDLIAAVGEAHGASRARHRLMGRIVLQAGLDGGDRGGHAVAGLRRQRLGGKSRRGERQDEGDEGETGKRHRVSLREEREEASDPRSA